MTNETEQLRALIATLHEALDVDPFCYTVQGDDSCYWCRNPRPHIDNVTTYRDYQDAQYHGTKCEFIAALSNTAESARLHNLAVQRETWLNAITLIKTYRWEGSPRNVTDSIIATLQRRAASLSPETRPAVAPVFPNLPYWRKGQTIFNFLEWLRVKKKWAVNETSLRMADPYPVSDAEFEALFGEFKAVQIAVAEEETR